MGHHRYLTQPCPWGLFRCSIKKYPKDSEGSSPEIPIKRFYNLTLSTSAKLALLLTDDLPPMWEQKRKDLERDQRWLWLQVEKGSDITMGTEVWVDKIWITYR